MRSRGRHSDKSDLEMVVALHIMERDGGSANSHKVHKGTVILIEPDPSVRDAIKLLLEGENWIVLCIDGGSELMDTVAGNNVTAVISESSLPDARPQEILKQCTNSNIPVIFTGHDLHLQGAVDLIRQGASDFLDKPFPQGRLLNLLNGLSTGQNN